MALLLFIFEIITTPIQRFWADAQYLWESKSYGKLTFSFLASLLCIVLMGITLGFTIIFLIKFHFEVILIIGGIIFLYSMVKKMFPTKPKEVEPVEDPSSYVYESAVNGYAPMRTIIYKTLKECATFIGAIPPRMLSEIEVPTEKFLIAHECAFFQFQIRKEEIKTYYNTADLEEFRKIIQNTFKQLWETGQFPQIALQTYMDGTGIILDPIIITNFEDLGNIYLLQVVYTTPAYVSYMRSYWEAQNASQTTNYTSNDERFL